MLFTKGFFTRIDALDVRMVVFAEGSRRLVDFWQDARRAGRNECDADIVVRYNEAYLRRGTGGNRIEKGGTQERFMNWAENGTLCRRMVIKRYFREPKSIDDCAYRNTCLLCDVFAVRTKPSIVEHCHQRSQGFAGIGAPNRTRNCFI